MVLGGVSHLGSVLFAKIQQTDLAHPLSRIRFFSFSAPARFAHLRPKREKIGITERLLHRRREQATLFGYRGSKELPDLIRNTKQ
jgi:hypothetical protein